MSSTAVELVDQFCDHLLEHVDDPNFQRKHFRAWLRSSKGRKVTDDKASAMLQTHRRAQDDLERPPRHVIACQSYGIEAWWQMVDHHNAISQEEWALSDASKRLVTDTLWEVMPALRNHPRRAAAIQFVQSTMESSIRTAVEFLRSGRD